MKHRTTLLRLSIAAMPLVLGACSENQPAPTESVRLAIIGTASHGGRLFSQQLTQEVTNTPVWAGDPDGTGTALITVNLGQKEVCWETTVFDITLPASASHIHKAGVGIRGPIVIALSPPVATGNGSGFASACRSGVDAALLRDILKNPEAYYVNVHTTDFPAGAIRGQIGQ
ncbi:MAG TPA: CHRD domain-containing protein [Gemmatimonadaceae bacterium]|nr:CHRD domain-containing protein [Gemmatimonadaceae bacterium]